MSFYKRVVDENIKLHKSEAYFYEIQHPEIFNVLEQRRIRTEIRQISRNLPTDCFCLDLASGTGNIANHLTSVGFKPIACDLSKDMLMQNQTPDKVLCELSFLPFRDKAVNLIITYSVFHHLPDLFKPLNEICRVCSVKGMVYFDHEPFVEMKQTKFSKIKRICLYLIWLFPRFKFWKRALQYFLWGRNRHAEYIRNVNFKLTDGNPVNTKSLVLFLTKNGFTIRLLNYGTGSLIQGRR